MGPLVAMVEVQEVLEPLAFPSREMVEFDSAAANKP